MADRPASPSVALRPVPAPQFDAPGMRAAPQPAVEIAGQLGAGIEAAGLAGFSLATRAQEYVDDARAADADNKLAERYRTILWEPDKGYLHRVGEQAVQERENALGALADTEAALAEGMTPHQRARFQRLAWARRQQAQHAVDVHFAREAETFYTGRAAARADGLFDDAVAAYFEPGGHDPAAWSPAQPKPYVPGSPAPSRFEGLKAAMRDQVRELAERTGRDVNGLLQERADAMAETIAGRLVDLGRPEEAEQVLQREGASQRLVSKMAGSIERGKAQVQANAIATEARTLAAVEGATLGTRLQRLAANESASPLAKALAAKQIIQDEKATHEALESWRKQVLQDAQTFAQVQTEAALPSDLQRALDEDPVLSARFSLWLAQGKQYVTTSAGMAFLGYLTDDALRSFQTPEALEAVIGPILSEEEKRAVRSRWVTARTPGAKDTDTDKADEQRQVFAYLQAPGKAPKLFGPTVRLTGEKADPQLVWRVDQFRAAVQRGVNDAFASSTGSRSLEQTRQEVMDAVWADGANVGGVWMPRVMMTPDELGQATLPHVTYNGVPVTPSMATGETDVTAPGFTRRLPTLVEVQDSLVRRGILPTAEAVQQEVAAALQARDEGAAADRRSSDALRTAWRAGLQSTIYAEALRAAENAVASGTADSRVALPDSLRGRGAYSETTDGIAAAVALALEPYRRSERTTWFRAAPSVRGTRRGLLSAAMPPGATEEDVDAVIAAVEGAFITTQAPMVPSARNTLRGAVGMPPDPNAPQLVPGPGFVFRGRMPR